MKPCLVKRGKQYAVKFFDEEKQCWTHRSLKTSKKAIAQQRFGEFIKDQHKKEFLGHLGIQPLPFKKLVFEFLNYMKSKRSPQYTQLVGRYSRKWIAFFGEEILSTAITPRRIEQYLIQRKKETCRVKGTQIRNVTVNRDFAALKHMFHQAEKWGYVESSPARHVQLLSHDSTVRTDYFIRTKLKSSFPKQKRKRAFIQTISPIGQSSYNWM